MPKFEVSIERTQVQHATLIVTAADSDTAETRVATICFALVQPIIDRVNEINAPASEAEAVVEGLATEEVRAEIVQIKEKFGTLRIYFHAEPKFVPGLNAMVNSAEAASAQTCEECGKPGRPRSGNWRKTLCDACSKGRAVIEDEE